MERNLVERFQYWLESIDLSVESIIYKEAEEDGVKFPELDGVLSDVYTSVGERYTYMLRHPEDEDELTQPDAYYIVSFAHGWIAELGNRNFVPQYELPINF